MFHMGLALVVLEQSLLCFRADSQVSSFPICKGLELSLPSSECLSTVIIIIINALIGSV